MNGVLFHATARDACHTLKLVTDNGFDRIIRLGKSNIFVAFPSDKGQGLISALDEVNVKKLRLQEAQFPYWVSDKVQKCFKDL